MNFSLECMDTILWYSQNILIQNLQQTFKIQEISLVHLIFLLKL